MAERQSPLAERSNTGHVKQHKSVAGVGTGGGGMGPLGAQVHSPMPGINAKSHPNDGKRGHIHHFKEHGHVGGSSHQFPGRRK